MPSNLAPEIIVTVQNPDPDQCDTTTSGSLESEDYSNNNSNSSNNITRSKSSRSKTSNDNNNADETADLPISENNIKPKAKLKSKHQHHHHHHHHQSNGHSKTHLTRKDSKATITTAIDMVEGKPRLWVSPRKSASAVRVQVTLHRPLNWQVVPAASSSAGSIPTKIVKQSSSSSKSTTTVTHSHSLSQSESLSFSISPSASILSAPNKCHSRSNNILQQRKGKVRFTELPRSRLGKHIEKIESKREEGTTTVSESLCFCRCAFSGDIVESTNINDDETYLSRSVFPARTATTSSLSSVLVTENANETNNDDDHNESVQYSGGGGGGANICYNARGIQYRRKNSRSASTRRRATSYHDGDRHRLDHTSSSSSSSDNEDKPRSSSFQRSCYQVDPHFGLRGTRRKKRNKSALSATVSAVNQGNDDEAQAGDSNNIFDPAAGAGASVKPISPSGKKKKGRGTTTAALKEKIVNEVVVVSGKKLVEKQDSQKENSILSSRCQYHASFVLKRPTGKNKGKEIILESSRSFDSVHSCSFNLRKKQNQQDNHHHCYSRKHDSGKSHEWAQHHHQCQFDPVMTWFKEPSAGAEDPHVNNKGSGMGANGSSHDGRLKSRSQSSSALYCIGKSGNGSVIEAQSNYGNHNHYSNCHSGGVNGLSSSIPADIWDLPCTAKSYSPISTAKQNRQNISHYYPENYHLDSHLSSGGPTTGLPDAETITTTGSNNSQLGHPPGLAIGANSSTTGANIVPVGQVSSRSGKKEKGAKKSGKSSNNRSKLYAASCPDVAEHTTYCGNLPVHPPSHHHHHHHHFDFTGDPRFIGINEAVAEELDSSCTSIATSAATVAMTGSSFADVRPYPLSTRNSGATAIASAAAMMSETNPTGVIGRGGLNASNHMAQSHPHLYASSSVNNSGTQAASMGMEVCCPGPGGVGGGSTSNMMGTGGPLFYSQQELQQFQPFQHSNNAHTHHQHFQQPQQQQPIQSGISVSGRSGSSRSSHHSRSYQNLPCSTQHHHHHQHQQQQYGSASINQSFNTSTSLSQQQLYNQHQTQFSHSSSTRSRRSIAAAAAGDTKCSQFQMPQFILPEYVFEVRLIRDHRGLGLSVTGGLDSQETYPGLIRVKKVFPMGPAYESGELRPYDIILEANGVALSGLTNHEALEVLRTTPTETILTICRPPINIPGFHDSSLSRSVDLSLTHLQSQSQPALNQLTQNGSQYQSQQLISCNQQQTTKPIKKTCVQCGGVQRHPPPQEQSNSSSSTTSLNPSVKSKSLSSLKIPPVQTQEPFGEFEVTLDKINGSLGFTLRQEDTSVLGHYVRALVKDPALSDGRIRPGDRIVSVNGQDLSEMSHTDAINYLRSCPTEVTLRLYRDVSPTPISPLSPTESHKSLKAKPLRKEAIDMLNDLAVRKQMSISSSGATPGSDPKHSLPGSVAGRTGLRGHRTLNQDVNGPATLPRRRLAHAGVTPSPEVLSAALSHFAGTAQTKTAKKSTKQEIPTTTTPPASNNSSSSGGSSGYRSSASRLTAANNSSSSNYPTETRSSGSGESTPVGTIISKHGKKTDLYRNYFDLRSVMNLDDDDDGIFKEDDDDDISPGGSSSVLDRDESDSEQTTPKARKPSFRNFNLHLDKISSLDDDESFTSDLERHHDSIVSEPGYPATDTEMGDGSNFKHGQPAYQSAILTSSTAAIKSRGKGTKFSKDTFGSGFRIAGGDSPSTLSDADIPTSMSTTIKKTTKTTQQTKDSKTSAAEPSPSTSGSQSASDSGKPGGLLKWKGVLFSHDDEEGGESTEDLVDSGELDSSFRKPVGTSGGGTISSIESRLSINEDGEEPGKSSMYLNARHPLPQRRSPDGREFRECDTEVVNINHSDGEQIFTVQLSRRWCSRLGFSLQGSEGSTFISAIYPDSVAAKDGRLRVGDELIMINGETVRGRSTTEIIDMMRKIRGVISITLHRRPNVEPEFNPKDHELGLT